MFISHYILHGTLRFKIIFHENFAAFVMKYLIAISTLLHRKPVKIMTLCHQHYFYMHLFSHAPIMFKWYLREFNCLFYFIAVVLFSLNSINNTHVTLVAFILQTAKHFEGHKKSDMLRSQN